VRFRGVIFDLWQTLVPWPVDSANRMYGRLVETWGADPEAFHELWHRRRKERETGPIEPHLRSIADELGLGGDLRAVMASAVTGRSSRLFPGRTRFRRSRSSGAGATSWG